MSFHLFPFAATVAVGWGVAQRLLERRHVGRRVGARVPQMLCSAAVLGGGILAFALALILAFALLGLLHLLEPDWLRLAPLPLPPLDAGHAPQRGLLLLVPLLLPLLPLLLLLKPLLRLRGMTLNQIALFTNPIHARS